MSEEKKFDPSRLFKARARFASIQKEWDEENGDAGGVEALYDTDPQSAEWIWEEKEAATKELAEAEAESLQQLRNSQTYSPMKRIWHHYLKWEEIGMWEKPNPKTREAMVAKAIEFTGNAELYGKWMLQALESWPISCEQNLSSVSTNRRAWIGHAACFLAIGCVEEVTREAWWQLTQEQRDAADAKATAAIKTWERNQAAKSYHAELV